MRLSAALGVFALLCAGAARPASAQLFAPDVPEASDEVFVASTVDDDSDLDSYRFNEVEITIPITRRFGEVDSEGRLLNADELIESGFLPPYAYVQISAGDIANSANQYDYVYLNGEAAPVGIMTGQAYLFKLYTFFLDIRQLRFPGNVRDSEGNLIPRNNTVRIDIDAFYNSTNPNRDGTNVDFVAVGFAETVRRPILLAHGWNSTPDTWTSVWRTELERLGYKYDTTLVAPALGRFRTVARGASEIAEAADFLRRENGVDRISIMAHSQGGIDSRRYLWDQPPNTVHTLVTMASPNGGVGSSVRLLNARPKAQHFEWDPSFWWFRRWNQVVTDTRWGIVGRDLSRESMELFNELDPVASNTLLHAYAASVPYGSLSGFQPPTLPFFRAIRRFDDPSLPSDGFVDTESVFSVPSAYQGDNCYQLNNSVERALHSNQTGNGDIFDFIWPRYLDGIEGVFPGGGQSRPLQGEPVVGAGGILAVVGGDLPLTRQPWASNAGAPGYAHLVADYADCVARPDTPAEAPRPFNRGADSYAETDGALGHVEAGETVSEPIVVDAADRAVFYLTSSSPGLEFELVTPSNAVIDSLTTTTGVTYANLVEDILVQTYEVELPEAGTWTARVRASPLAADSVGYAVYASLGGTTIDFDVSGDEGQHVVGGNVPVFATLTGASGTVEATVIDPAGSTMTVVPMADNGVSPDVVANDGTYSGLVSTVGGDPGWYSFAARALGTGGAFTRSAHTLLPVAAEVLSAPTVVGDAGVDRNGNGLYDSLRVTVSLQVTAPGRYLVKGTLANGTGVTIDNASTFDELSSGTHPLTLDFDGRAVRRSGQSGPYGIRGLTVVRLDVDENEPYPTATATATTTTGSYSATQFERSGIELAGGFSYSVTDTDADGRYDKLTVNVPVSLLYSDQYKFQLALTAPDGRPVAASGFGPFPISPGTYVVPFEFSGDAIRASGIDGPYIARNLLIDGEARGSSLVVGRVLGTDPYSFTDFGDPSTLGGCESAGNGPWSVPSTWTSCGGAVPGASDSATIAQGHVVHLDGDVTVAGVLVGAGGALNVSGGTGKSLTVTGNVVVEPTAVLTASPATSGTHSLNLSGSITVDGTVDLGPQATTVRFTGGTAATAGGRDTLRVPTLDVDKSSATLQLSGAVEIREKVVLTAGTLDIQGERLALLSDSASGRMATLVRSGGTLVGDLTVQRRYMGQESWRLVSAPVAALPFSALNDPFHTQGTPWAEFSFGGSNFFAFDGATQSYTVPQQDGPFEPGRGYFLYVYENEYAPAPPYVPILPATWEVSGQESGSAFTVAVPFNNGDPGQSYSLLGNPFAAALDWDQIGGTNGIGLTYESINSAGAYVSYQAGGVDAGAGRYIAPFQGFWVQATAMGASVDFDRAVVVADGADPLVLGRSVQAPLAVRFSLAPGQPGDGALGTSQGPGPVVVLSTRADVGPDALDAAYFGPGSGRIPAAGIWFGSPSSPLMIEGRPASGEQSVDLHVAPSATGPHTLRWTGADALQDGWAAVLVDTETGDQVDLRGTSSHSFVVNAPVATHAVPAGGPPPPPPAPKLGEGDGTVQTRTAADLSAGKEMVGASSYAAGPRFRVVFTAPASAFGALGAPEVSAEDRTLTVAWRDASQGSSPAGVYAVQVTRADSTAWTDLGAVRPNGDGGYVVATNDLNYGRYRVRVVRTESSGATSTSPEVEARVGVAGTHALGLLRPNPFRDGALASLAVAETQRVVAEVYDMLGRRVAVVFDGEVPADVSIDLRVDGRALASGSYVLRVQGTTFAQVRKITVFR